MFPVNIPLEHRFAQVNGIRMHYVEAGKGETVLFLHGFPENWYSWRHQLDALAANYHVVAPDLRGYNETENRGPYDTDTLQEDVLALIDYLAVERVHLVAHDWGGIIAWLFAMNHGDRLHSLTVCNVPHPIAAEKAFRSLRQLSKSWYIFFFQLPFLPEWAASSQGYQQLARALIHDCRPGTFSREDIKFFLDAWRRQGLGGGINYYRALMRHRPKFSDPPPIIETPTLFVWGENDRALGKELTFGTEKFVPNLQMEYLPGISHWVQQEAAGEVNRLLAAHVAANGSRS